jgi:hypothetical protein
VEQEGGGAGMGGTGMDEKVRMEQRYMWVYGPVMQDDARVWCGEYMTWAGWGLPIKSLSECLLVLCVCVCVYLCVYVCIT